MYIVHVFQSTNQYLMTFFQRGPNADRLGLTHKRALTAHATHLGISPPSLVSSHLQLAS
jgi:hypothetical protein